MTEATASRGQFAIITGAAGSIGQPLIEEFSAAGYRTIAMDLHRPPQSCPFDHYLKSDLRNFVSDEIYASELLAEAKNLLAGGELKVLINNAANQRLNPVHGLCREDWTASMEVNALAPFFLVQGMLDELTRSRGSVVNIGSIHSRLTKKGFTAYAASKAALESITRSMAIELGDRIRINSIAPAAINTPMLSAGFDHDMDKMNALKACHPTGSIGSPIEVAKLARVMAQDDLQFLNGSTINLDGGISGRLYDPD